MFYNYNGKEYKINYNVVDVLTRDYDIWLENPEDTNDTVFVDNLDFATQSALFDMVEEDINSAYEESFSTVDDDNINSDMYEFEDETFFNEVE
jgi:hypothetical protein